MLGYSWVDKIEYLITMQKNQKCSKAFSVLCVRKSQSTQDHVAAEIIPFPKMPELITLITLNLNNLHPIIFTEVAKELSKHLVLIFNALEHW